MLQSVKRKFGDAFDGVYSAFEKVRLKKPKIETDDPIFTSKSEIALWKELQQIVDAILISNVKIVDLKQREKDLADTQRNLFGGCLKHPFIFNPLSNSVDLRFMAQTNNWTVDDPVYTFMAKQALAPKYQLYLLRAVSGAGKTGTILNAVARRAYLIYVQCDSARGGIGRDYVRMVNKQLFSDFDQVDESVQTFIQELEKALKLVQDEKKKQDIALCHCQLFWLSRILTLSYLRTNHSFTPEQWIFWSNNRGGKARIQNVQLNFVKILEDKELESMKSSLRSITREATRKFGTKLWLGIDEAQIFQTVMVGNRSLLQLLIIEATANASNLHMIVAGTRISAFAKLVHSGVSRKLNIFDLAESNTLAYPYVTSDKASMLLSYHFDMHSVMQDESLMKKARYILQGRLRNVVRLFQLLQDTIEEDSSLDLPQLFSTAINTLEREIEAYINERLQEFLQNPLIRDKFLLHLVTLLYASTNKKGQTWDIDVFKQRFGCEPEDSGFLFFEKRQPDVSKPAKCLYQYSICEDYVTDILLMNPDIRSFKLMQALDLLTDHVNNTAITPQEFGMEFERLIGHLMLSTVNNIVDVKCKPRPSWLSPLVSEWKAVMSYTCSQLNEAFAVLKASFVTYSPKELWKHLASNNQLWNFFFTNDYSLYKVLSDAALVKYLQQVIKCEENKSDKYGELLFFLIQPRDMLLNPSTLLGPDIVGFIRGGFNSEVCLFTASVSIYESKNDQKYQKNQCKLSPNHFYYSERKRGYYTFANILKPLKLSSLPRLSINITVPSPVSPASPAKKKSDGRVVELLIGEDDLECLDPNFAETITLLKEQLANKRDFWVEAKNYAMSQDIDFESDTMVPNPPEPTKEVTASQIQEYRSQTRKAAK